MREALKEVSRRRKIQLEYNKEHKLPQKSITKPIRERILPKKEEEPEFEEESLTPGEARRLV